MKQLYEEILDKLARNQDLTEAEKVEYEALKKTDAFDDALSFRANLVKASTALGRQDLKRRLSTIDRKQKRKRLVVITVIAALFVSLIAYYYFNGETRNHQRYFAEYFEPYPNVVSPITKGLDEMDGYHAYERGNYDLALSILSEEDNENSTFYRAQIYTAQREFDLAIPMFIEGLKNNRKDLREKSEWFLALAYLGKGSVDLSKTYLKGITENNSHLFFDQAVLLIKELEK